MALKHWALQGILQQWHHLMASNREGRVPAAYVPD